MPAASKRITAVLQPAAAGQRRAPSLKRSLRLREPRPRQCLCAKGAAGAGANRRPGAAGSNRLRTGTAALQRLRAGVHSRGAGRGGAGQVRRDGVSNDCAAQVRQRHSFVSAGESGTPAATPKIIQNFGPYINPFEIQLVYGTCSPARNQNGRQFLQNPGLVAIQCFATH